MSLKRKLKRKSEKEIVDQKEKIERFWAQKEMEARLSGVDEAVRYFEDRLHSNVRKIPGIGPKRFHEICLALGFEEVKEG
jgi:hypothetical protein